MRHLLGWGGVAVGFEGRATIVWDDFHAEVWCYRDFSVFMKDYTGESTGTDPIAWVFV